MKFLSKSVLFSAVVSLGLLSFGASAAGRHNIMLMTDMYNSASVAGHCVRLHRGKWTNSRISLRAGETFYIYPFVSANCHGELNALGNYKYHVPKNLRTKNAWINIHM